MRRKVFLAIVFLVMVVMVTGETSFRMHAKMKNGSVQVVNTVGNRTLRLSVEGNGTMELETLVDNNTLNYSLNASGSGKVEANASSQEYLLEMVKDDKKVERKEGQGIFSQVVWFFNNLFTWGWVR